jgi:hypothetical protein
MPFFRLRCRPRILVVTDGALSYLSSNQSPFGRIFGLSRFIEAIADDPSAHLTPSLTLAHRNNAHPSSVSIAGTNYSVDRPFSFVDAATPVTLANYDQLWLFGNLQEPFPISDAEVQVIANFMNAGGGVFATGDHADIGAGMCARLPRIRHMRNWKAAGSGGVPMGGEELPLALERIDTVWNSGGTRFQFNDQADNIPQRIFPNYAVAGDGKGSWSATIHPVLRLPGAPLSRSNPAIPLPGQGGEAWSQEFSNDMDVLPDHPHESECLEVSATEHSAALNGTYDLAGMNFPEFPNNASGAGRVGSQIVAFAVSGGRTVWNDLWKPPVKPRMFGAIAAFDGHLGNALDGAGTRPGRIVVDSTWHHFVNVNLDGDGTPTSGRQGLGTWSGTLFTPSADLRKIYKYYQNMVDWLQPLHAVWCDTVIIFDDLRERFASFEELMAVGNLESFEDYTIYGKTIAAAIDSLHGPGTAMDLVGSAMRASDQEHLALLVDPQRLAQAGIGLVDITGYVLGRIGDMVLKKTSDLSAAPQDEEDGRFEKLYGELEHEMKRMVPELAREALKVQVERVGERAEKSRELLQQFL